MIKKGDFVLVDKDAAEFTFETDYFAKVIYAEDYYQIEAMNGSLYDIEHSNKLHKVNKTLLNQVISEAHKFYFDNFYYPELQIVIDAMEEFDDLLDYLEEHYNNHDEADVELSALLYDITLLIEVFKYKREENWYCKDLEILESMERYVRLFKEII